MVRPCHESCGNGWVSTGAHSTKVATRVESPLLVMCYITSPGIDGIKEVIAKLLQGQLETKQNLDQLMKCVVYVSLFLVT